VMTQAHRLEAEEEDRKSTEGNRKASEDTKVARTTRLRASGTVRGSFLSMRRLSTVVQKSMTTVRRY
jgi:hypothetical protein